VYKLNIYTGCYFAMQQTDLVILGFIVCVIVIYNIRRSLIKRRLQSKLGSANRRQLKAAELLESRGFKIMDVNRHVVFSTETDRGKYSDVAVVDLVVKKGFSRYIVKLISEKQFPRFNTRQVREALTSRLILFGVGNLLLVDLDKDRVKHIKVRVRKPLKQKLGAFLMPGVAFILGVIFALYVWLFIV